MSLLIRKRVSSHAHRVYSKAFEKNPGNFAKSRKQYLCSHQVDTSRFPNYVIHPHRPLSASIGGSSGTILDQEDHAIRRRVASETRSRNDFPQLNSGTFRNTNFRSSTNPPNIGFPNPNFEASLSLLHSTITPFATYRAFSSLPFDTIGLRPLGDSRYRCFSSSEPSGKRSENVTSRSPNYSTSAKIPTPKSSQSTAASGPLGSFDVAALARSAASSSATAIKAIVIFILKLPYNSWYYLTRPEERRAKIAEIIEITKKEVNHYWMGTKLLMADVRTARSLLGRTLQGSTLTRRERKQLLRTVSDLFRIVPFSMFLIIPFMEFALPFALRIFPNLLPSTFQDSLKAEENMKRELQSRISMAQFFQETLEELAKEQKRIASKRIKENTEGETNDENGSKVEIASKQRESAASMLEFLDRARRGEMMPPAVIIQYANYFQDDLTLDNMPRMQLVNMCKYMSIAPYGSDAFLRFQLRHRIRTLKEDDQRILWEGIGSLTKMELREACQERGMRSTGLSKEAYRRSLQQWLDLSVNKNVPISLLIMSRSFFLEKEVFAPGTDDDSKSVAGLADAISGLDKEVLNEVILEVATSEEKKSDPDVRAIKLEVVTQQNERIRQEQAEREAAAKKKESAEKKESTQKDTSEKADTSDLKVETAVPAVDKAQSGSTPNNDKSAGGGEADAVLTIVDEDETKKISKEDPEKEKDNLSTEELEAIAQLLTADPVSKERAELERIKLAMHADGVEEEELAVSSEDNPITAKSTEGLESVAVSAEATIVTDEAVGSQVKGTEKEAAVEAHQSTVFTTASEIPQDIAVVVDIEESETTEEPEDPVVARLKKRIESMVEKIEGQLSDVQIKIGDKLHFLDKDMDGILSREEMAECLQQVFKREITFDEAMEIASEMDDNEDGVFTVQELIRWIETNTLLRLEKEGRDADMERIMAGNSEADRSAEGNPDRESKAAEHQPKG